MVWVVDPAQQTVRVYRPDQPVRVLRAEDTLNGEEVLPGLNARSRRYSPGKGRDEAMAVTAEKEIYTLQNLQEISRTVTGRWEVVRGRLRELAPANFKHGVIAGRLFARLYQFAESHGVGYVLMAETGFILSEEPVTLRAPDVAFVRRERVPTGDLPEQFAHFAPDLVVEVLSPSDTYSALAEKVSDWLEAGVLLVWVVDPADRTVSVHRVNQPVRVLKGEDTLSGEEVLPGFECKVSEIFAL